MADRVVHDDLLDDDRWLDLPSDTQRIVFVMMQLWCDDYGNFLGGTRRILRWMERFSEVRNEQSAISVMMKLQDVGLIQRYEVGGKEYWHIMGFRNSRRYFSRKVPASPYPEQNVIPSKQRDAKKPAADLRVIDGRQTSDRRQISRNLADGEERRGEEKT